MGRPFGVESERRRDRPSVVRRRARTGQSPDPRAADICPVGPRAAFLREAPRSSPGVVRSPGSFSPVQLGGLPIERDVSVGVWISSARRRGTPGTVAAILPDVFDAYARVLHPAVRYAGDDDLEVPWAEVAAHNGTSSSALMRWRSITRGPVDSQPPVWDDAPSEGHLPVALADRLSRVLRRHTRTPDDCFFGRWDGFGYDLRDPDDPPRLLLRGGQDMVLLRGTVADS